MSVHTSQELDSVAGLVTGEKISLGGVCALTPSGRWGSAQSGLWQLLQTLQERMNAISKQKLHRKIL